MSESLHWRRIAATLADPDRRLLYARLVVADAPLPVGDLDAATRRRLKALVGAGLAAIGDAAAGPLDPFSALLSAQPAQRPIGPERFLRNGRLSVLPRTQRDRSDVLGWLADRVTEGADVWTEKDVTARLAEVADDPVAVRRYLVDAGLLVRDLDGRNYRRGCPAPVAGREPSPTP